jgi:hypothetical protein
MPPNKDAPGLRTPGIYNIPCESGRVYIGQSGRSIQLRIKERDRHIRLLQPEKSTVDDHSFNHDHIIKLHDTRILSTNPATWITSSERPLKLRCTLITSPGMGASTLASPGSHYCID